MRQRTTGRVPTVRHAVSGDAERRRSPRIQHALPAVLVAGERRWEVEVTELSRNGARLCGRGSFGVGEAVVLEVHTPAGDLALAARIVWVDRARRRVAGLDFGAPDPAQLAILDAVLAALAGEVAAASPAR